MIKIKTATVQEKVRSPGGSILPRTRAQPLSRHATLLWGGALCDETQNGCACEGEGDLVNGSVSGGRVE